MEKRDAFKERERGLEGEYFHKQDKLLLEKLRKRSQFDDIARALGEKLQVDDPKLLERVKQLGVTLETGSAFLLAPLVQVAWAEGQVSAAERKTILAIAVAGGIADKSPAYNLLVKWLDRRPPDELFETALAVLKAGLSVLPTAEREERVKQIIETCTRVARASGGLGWLLGVDHSVSGQEKRLLDAIAARLRAAQTPPRR